MSSREQLARDVEALSPYVGKLRAMHVWLAQHCTEDGLVTADPITLSQEMGVTRPYASTWLWRAVKEGYLEVLVDRRRNRAPSTYRIRDPREAMAL